MTLTQARSRASFQTRLLLHLANRRSRHAAAEGFTLVELMIVVAILGILAAVALPNFLQARSSSIIGSQISQAVSFAKACSVYQTTQIGSAPTNSSGSGTSTVSFSGGCSTGTTPATVTATWGTERAAGVRCLATTTSATSATAAITVTSTTTGETTIACDLS